MSDRYVIGLDFGTNSARAIIVNARNGEEIAGQVFEFPSGEKGVVLDARNPDLARQNPADYLEAVIATVQGALRQAAATPGFSPDAVIGIGVDTTGSTPLPVDREGTPLALLERFAGNPAAMAWLWKDHTGHAEAAEITAVAAKMRPQYLAKCGGAYSSEWFWSKILQCKRSAPEVFDAAYTWVEHADWMTGILTGTAHPDVMKRCICAAGHKAMFNPGWSGYPGPAQATSPPVFQLIPTQPLPLAGFCHDLPVRNFAPTADSIHIFVLTSVFVSFLICRIDYKIQNPPPRRWSSVLQQSRQETS